MSITWAACTEKKSLWWRPGVVSAASRPNPEPQLLCEELGMGLIPVNQELRRERRESSWAFSSFCLVISVRFVFTESLFIKIKLGWRIMEDTIRQWFSPSTLTFRLTHVHTHTHHQRKTKCKELSNESCLALSPPLTWTLALHYTIFVLFYVFLFMSSFYFTIFY